MISRLAGAVWRFVVGDDWRSALGVALALAATAALAGAEIAAWWLMPLSVCGLLYWSLKRASDRA